MLMQEQLPASSQRGGLPPSTAPASGSAMLPPLEEAPLVLVPAPAPLLAPDPLAPDPLPTPPRSGPSPLAPHAETAAIAAPSARAIDTRVATEGLARVFDM